MSTRGNRARDEEDFGFEPIPGLPHVLPPGERILWQGAPHWFALARHAFRLGWVLAYFIALAAWRGLSAIEDRAGGLDILQAVLWPLAAGGLLGIGIGVVAWYAARTTRYTITTRRIVFRIGMALTVSVNLPFAVIGAADLRRNRDGSGDLMLAVMPPARVSWLMFWPHARPWHFRRPQPALRCVPEPEKVAAILARALAASAAVPVAAVEQPARATETGHGMPAAA
jgi:hypothetical protein